MIDVAHRLRGAACAAALGALVAACGGGPAKPGQDAAADAPPDTPADTPPPDSTAGNEPVGDAGDAPPSTTDARDEREVPDTGSCPLPITQDGTCNAVVLQGATIASTCSTAATPVARGGTIEDGTYVLDSVTFYGTCPNGIAQQRITWVICGNAWETVQDIQRISGDPDGGMITERVGLSITPQQAAVVGSVGCWNGPGTGPTSVTWGYDATPGHLTLYIPYTPGVRVASYTKQ